MPTFRYAKLVRDNIPNFHREAGHSVVGHRLENDMLVNALVEKLHEEADEISGALSQSELIEEIADVQQIINDLCVASEISQEVLAEAIAAKAKRKGGFLQGEYIDTVTIPNEDDEWTQYCRRSPGKYPEV